MTKDRENDASEPLSDCGQPLPFEKVWKIDKLTRLDKKTIGGIAAMNVPTNSYELTDKNLPKKIMVKYFLLSWMLRY